MVYRQNTMFRSADMSLVQLYCANEIGREVVSALGEIGMMQFRDLNEETTAFQRTFTQEIRRLDNVERQLRYFREQMDKNEIPLRSMPSPLDELAAPSSQEIEELSERSQSLEQRVSSLNDSYETLKLREVELTEWRWVLRKAGEFFDRAHGHTDEITQNIDEGDEAPLLQDIEQSRQNGDAQGETSFSVMNIGFVAGVIPRERLAAFERILWRTLRGNLYMNQSEIPEPTVDPSTNETVDKNVFVVFAHGKDIITKIRKISESLGANLYGVDENADLRRDQVHEVNSRLNDLGSVLRNTKQTLDAELHQISRSIGAWMIVVKKEKSVYETLNMFSYDHARKTLIAEGWVPTNSLALIQSTLRDVTERAGLSVPSIINEIRTSKTPPSYVKTNKFTVGFQSIINAYGTQKYQEVNPGLPTIVTFPFLFAVMFGDLGHGFIMVCAAIAMILYEKRLARAKLDEIVGMAFFGRYIMLMMGIFSMFTGLIYNDCFSKPIYTFNTSWTWKSTGEEHEYIGVAKDGYRYPFGLDWAWHETENALLFSNSLKMKLSILLGWTHMTYSLCLSDINARHFKTPIDIFGNFIPGMIFFQSIFGYLIFCVVYKWSIDWLADGLDPPGLLNMLIYMFLQPGTIEKDLYSGQKFIQIVLVLLALACVPILLFLKPFYLRWENNKARASGYASIGETERIQTFTDEDDRSSRHYSGRDSVASDSEGVALITEMNGGADIGEHGEHEEFDFGEIMIHQVIHTIEFCLNCVSHTASYLRLWALSLAHQQLSIVLWNMTMNIALGGRGIAGTLMTVALFYMWFVLTVIILCVMEGTSAMLHSLRLHWVEAMSKHFIGEGVSLSSLNTSSLYCSLLTTVSRLCSSHSASRPSWKQRNRWDRFY
jgi:V-type H+-transporting ATPase subunit a